MYQLILRNGYIANRDKILHTRFFYYLLSLLGGINDHIFLFTMDLFHHNRRTLLLLSIFASITKIYQLGLSFQDHFLILSNM